MINSPLGQYAPLVATVTALGVIGAYLVALLFGSTLGIPETSLNNLQNVALIALGAVFGSAVSVNGWKQPLAATHSRLDRLEKDITLTAATAGVPVADLAGTHEDK